MESHPEVLSQTSRNSVLVRQNILEKVGHRQAANQIDVEQKAAASKLNDEMRKMRKSLLPSVEKEEDNPKKRQSLNRDLSIPASSLSTRTSLGGQTHQMSKRTEKRSKSDGALVGTTGDNTSGTTSRHIQGFPPVENRARPDNMFAPMTYWGLKQQRREEEKGAAGGGRFEERSKGPLDKDFEERLKSFMMMSPNSPRSLSIDATSFGGGKGGGGAGNKGGRNSDIVNVSRKSGPKDAGLSAQQVNWLKSLAPKESVFIDEDADNEFEKIHTPRLKIEDSDHDEGFPLASLPPTKLPPIYKTQPKIIENQKSIDESPVKQNLRSSLPPPDWDSMKNTRYLRPKAKRIQEWYDLRSKNGPR